MCIICLDWQKGKLTSKEAYGAIGEMFRAAKTDEEKEHLFELSEKILAKEVPESEIDGETEENWWNKTHASD